MDYMRSQEAQYQAFQAQELEMNGLRLRDLRFEPVHPDDTQPVVWESKGETFGSTSWATLQARIWPLTGLESIEVDTVRSYRYVPQMHKSFV